MQLELSLWPRNCVRVVLQDYLAMKADGLSSETLENDYRWRTDWLCDVLGEATPVVEVTFSTLEGVARAARGVIRDWTIRKRLVLYIAALKYAAMRGVLPREAIPELPPWLRNDSIRCQDYYTLVQFQHFRLAIAPGRFRRRGDLGFWTGQHTYDLSTMTRVMLDPDFEWRAEDGTVSAIGRWLRRNHKNPKCVAAWVPMQPELRALAVEWLRERGAPDQPIVGRMNNVNRTFQAAAARADLQPIRPCLGLRASHATLLMARGESYEYVRQVLGHEGEVAGSERADGSPVAVTSKHPTMLTRHYLRPSPELFARKRNR